MESSIRDPGARCSRTIQVPNVWMFGLALLLADDQTHCFEVHLSKGEKRRTSRFSSHRTGMIQPRWGKAASVRELRVRSLRLRPWALICNPIRGRLLRLLLFNTTPTPVLGGATSFCFCAQNVNIDFVIVLGIESQNANGVQSRSPGSRAKASATWVSAQTLQLPSRGSIVRSRRNKGAGTSTTCMSWRF